MRKRNSTRPGFVTKATDNGPQLKGWSLDKAFSAFRDDRKAASCSINTIRHYEKSWALFTKYAKVQGIEEIRDVESRHINGFLVAMDGGKETPVPNPRGGPYAPTTKRKTAVDLRTIFGWLTTQKEKGKRVLEESPSVDAAMPPEPELVLPPYTDGELTKLLKACEGLEVLRIRDRALLLFLLDSAARREEAQCLRIQDVDLEEGAVTILDGKGGVTRTSRIGQITRKALAKYLALPFMDMDPTEPLWWGKFGPLTYEGFGEVIEHIGERAKIKGGCHKLRRTAAIRMLRSGASLEDVRRLLGHRDFQVIQKYLAYVDDDLRRAHNKHSPVDTLEAAQPKKRGLSKRSNRRPRKKNGLA
jgi:site-specific recombinase XerD